MKSQRRFQPALAFIFVTAMLDIMAMGIIIPVLPSLIEEFVGPIARAGLWNGALVARIFGWIYTLSAAELPGLNFLISAGVLLSGAILGAAVMDSSSMIRACTPPPVYEREHNVSQAPRHEQ